MPINISHLYLDDISPHNHVNSLKTSQPRDEQRDWCANRQALATQLRQTIAILLRKHFQPAPCGHRLHWLTKTLAAL